LIQINALFHAFVTPAIREDDPFAENGSGKLLSRCGAAVIRMIKGWKYD